jgi:hypothetical protein
MREKGAQNPELHFPSATTFSSEARERIKRQLTGEKN